MAKVATLDDTRNWRKAEPFKEMDDATFADEIRRQTDFMKMITDEAVRRGIQIKHEGGELKISKTSQL